MRCKCQENDTLLEACHNELLNVILAYFQPPPPPEDQQQPEPDANHNNEPNVLIMDHHVLGLDFELLDN